MPERETQSVPNTEATRKATHTVAPNPVTRSSANTTTCASNHSPLHRIDRELDRAMLGPPAPPRNVTASGRSAPGLLLGSHWVLHHGAAAAASRRLGRGLNHPTMEEGDPGSRADLRRRGERMPTG